MLVKLYYILVSKSKIRRNGFCALGRLFTSQEKRVSTLEIESIVVVVDVDVNVDVVDVYSLSFT